MSGLREAAQALLDELDECGVITTIDDAPKINALREQLALPLEPDRWTEGAEATAKAWKLHADCLWVALSAEQDRARDDYGDEPLPWGATIARDYDTFRALPVPPAPKDAAPETKTAESEARATVVDLMKLLAHMEVCADCASGSWQDSGCEAGARAYAVIHPDITVEPAPVEPEETHR